MVSIVEWNVCGSRAEGTSDRLKRLALLRRYAASRHQTQQADGQPSRSLGVDR